MAAEAAAGPGDARLCCFCFDVLAHHLGLVPSLRPVQLSSAAFPLFVTWDMTPRNGGPEELRGCIGNFSAMPLREGLEEYALTSALRDRRFSPITADEVPRLSCHVSLLTDFEQAADYLDWQIGVHGVWIEFRDDAGHKKTATYLPSVAQDQGWTKVETIDSLLRKGGFRGTVTERKRRELVLTRYQAVVSVASYQQYQAYRTNRPTGVAHS